jgi:hypothetical protein
VDAREQRAKEIVAGGRIAFANGYWLVPSQSSAARHKVVVETLFPSCSCPDFELTDKPCKHILAVRLFIEQRKAGTPPQPTATEPAPKIKRPTYPQNWPTYNAAQTNEKAHFQVRTDNASFRLEGASAATALPP